MARDLRTLMGQLFRAERREPDNGRGRMPKAG